MLVGGPYQKGVLGCVAFKVKDCIGNKRTVWIDIKKVGIGSGDRVGEGGIGVGVGGVKISNKGTDWLILVEGGIGWGNGLRRFVTIFEDNISGDFEECTVLIGYPDKEVVIGCVVFEIKDCVGNECAVLIDAKQRSIRTGNGEGEGGIGIGVGGIKVANDGTDGLVFKEAQWCRVIQVGGGGIGGGVRVRGVGTVIRFDEVGKAVSVGIVIIITGAQCLFLSIGKSVVIVVFIGVVNRRDGKVFIERFIFVITYPQVDEIGTHWQGISGNEIEVRNRKFIPVGRSISIEEGNLVGVSRIVIRVGGNQCTDQFSGCFSGADRGAAKLEITGWIIDLEKEEHIAGNPGRNSSVLN